MKRTYRQIRTIHIVCRAWFQSSNISCVVQTRLTVSATRMVHMIVSPLSALVDERVNIEVSQLNRNQEITLHASLVDGSKRYSSYAYFTANQDGKVDVSRVPSEGGTYKGVDGEGLLWSLALEPGQRKGTRLIKKDVTTPFIVNISTYSGRHNWETLCTNYQNHCLKNVASCQIQRWYMDIDKVKRIPVREGNVRGTLFLPRGEGPFPCVIDMFGSGGGLMEHRAALLASRGFAVLALAFFQYEDLPEYISDIDLVYFEEALDWMIRQRFKNDRGVGVVAVSGGADIGICMATYFKDKVHAAVLINPSFRFVGFPARFKDVEFNGIVSASTGYVETSDGLENRGDETADINSIPESDRLKIEDTTAKILLLQSGDDRVVQPVNHWQLVKRLEKKRDPKDYEAVCYPGAGHLLEPPFAPLTKIVFQTNFNLFVHYGGVPHLHNKAQVDAWGRTLTFLRKHLCRGELPLKSKI